MPGIFGVLQHTPSARAVAEQMRAAMHHHDWYGTAVYGAADDTFAAGTMALSAAAARIRLSSSGSGSVIVMDGEIDDATECRRQLERHGVQTDSDDAAEILLRGYERLGDAFLSAISGYFAAAIWEPPARTVLLVNDRFGMKPLYYARSRDGIAFASELKAVLRAPVNRTRSLKGLAQFCTFGHFLGEDTFFEQIRYAPPAAVIKYSIDTRTLEVRRYWRLTQGTPIGEPSEALDAIGAAFTNAVTRRLSGSTNLGLSLSGGLDARTILAVVPTQRVHLKTLSIGIRGSIDHRVASHLASLAGAEHHCHYLDADFLGRFREHLQALTWLTDGHYLDQGITVPTLPVYRRLGIDVVLRGHAGELLHMDKAYAFSIRSRDLSFPDGAAVERWLWSHLTEYMIGGVGHQMFRPELRETAAELARDSLRQAMAESAAVEPPAQRVWHLFVSERLRRETALSLQMFNSVVDIRLPYLDNELIDVVMRVPPALKMGDGIQSFILQRARPSFLGVTNANTGTKLGASAVARELASFRLKLLSKLRVPGYQPYERLGLWLSRQLQPLVRDSLLSDRALDRGVFDRHALAQIVDEHTRRVRNHTFLLMALIIFETGQRQLLEGEELPLAVPS